MAEREVSTRICSDIEQTYLSCGRRSLLARLRALSVLKTHPRASTRADILGRGSITQLLARGIGDEGRQPAGARQLSLLAPAELRGGDLRVVPRRYWIRQRNC